MQIQLECVESVAPEYVLCWIGNNDVLSAASALDVSQLTSPADFERDYVELADRLKVLIHNNGTRVVFANIPNVTDIGFLLREEQVEAVPILTKMVMAVLAAGWERACWKLWPFWSA